MTLRKINLSTIMTSTSRLLDNAARDCKQRYSLFMSSFIASRLTKSPASTVTIRGGWFRLSRAIRKSSINMIEFLKPKKIGLINFILKKG